MIVRKLEEMVGTDRDVPAPTFNSRRFLLAGDGVPFSFHDTILYKGTSTRMWYKHHVEAVYCIEGKATLEDLETGKVYDVGPGTMYCLDEHDRHILTVEEDVRMVCVFSPALTGDEVHDDEGAYPLLNADAPGGQAATPAR